MKNSFKYIGSAIVAGLLLSSCSLDEDNPHAGDATLNNFQAWYGMQATCYFPLNNELYSSSDWLIMAETGTDIWVSSNNGDYAKQIFNYEEFGTSTNNSKKLWKQAYTTISTCNTVINEVDNILDGEADAKNILVAEAKTLRAFYYSLLVSQFGPVTLNLESSSSITGIVDLYPKRASEKDIYAQIIKDLSEAIPVLPVEPYGGNRARVTKKTAKGLLCRVYAQRAGLGDKFFGDGKEYWTLARDCAEDMITNKGTYGAYLYSDIADMWADANNRQNKEALFIASAADPYNEIFNLSTTTKNNKLFSYSCGGFIEDDFYNGNSNGKPTKGGSYFYGRLNQQVWQPSEYLMYCFNPEWDRRWEYTWLYTASTFTFLDWGGSVVTPRKKATCKLTEDICNKYGIDKSQIGQTLQPFADCSWINNGAFANQYNVRIWPLGVTEDDASKLLRVATSSAEFGSAGVANTTKAYAVPYPVASNDNRFNTLFVHKPLTADEKAKCPYVVITLSDCYNDTYPYGNTANGSAGSTLPVGNGTAVNGKVCPSLIKFNWAYDGCYTSNLQIKIGDMYIMRFAEVYLIAAEANQMLGDGARAAGFINDLRKRSLRPGYAGNYELATATEDDVLDEYARELCGEFSRWNLLKRHNNIEERLARYNKRAAKSFKPYMYNRPISQEFLDVILNAEEYGDNGYGSTASSGLSGLESY
ncbi:RagB/SusD family nutrient uptake outer membrane protein [Duncaniella freteri]|jgi:hypothetical protein|uniref:RagB/SusD family nutrient uptake outer membrane protein n=18 Tax=Duncaniella TaxID=2518495 RepID=A0A4Z0V7T9_9BACT|nr:RagB/SusD family nutrient uptake outer membrane protein [Duncaniella freteri]NBJ05819.1 RagB/SusD family nutrient uptake outer membrane protein [Alistipes sp. Z76]NCE67806.1 RagB/SusD family nutrient uptake outer membrane protein [Muribaculaceae bacterium M3]TGG39458.1 RagB/SusD family nutrient uptake outer membrane protein [Duncaniella freteri]